MNGAEQGRYGVSGSKMIKKVRWYAFSGTAITVIKQKVRLLAGEEGQHQEIYPSHMVDG